MYLFRPQPTSPLEDDDNDEQDRIKAGQWVVDRVVGMSEFGQSLMLYVTKKNRAKSYRVSKNEYIVETTPRKTEPYKS